MVACERLEMVIFLHEANRSDDEENAKQGQKKDDNTRTPELPKRDPACGEDVLNGKHDCPH